MAKYASGICLKMGIRLVRAQTPLIVVLVGDDLHRDAVGELDKEHLQLQQWECCVFELREAVFTDFAQRHLDPAPTNDRSAPKAPEFADTLAYPALHGSPLRRPDL